MKCNKAKILLSAALDGELSRGEALALERHLAACNACAVEKAEYSALRETMVLWADEEPSAWLAENFAYKLSQLRERGHAVPRRPRWIFGTAAAGLATAFLAFALLMHSHIQPPIQQRIEKPTVTHTAPPVEAPVVKPAPTPIPKIVTAKAPSHTGRAVARAVRPTHKAATPKAYQPVRTNAETPSVPAVYAGAPTSRNNPKPTQPDLVVTPRITIAAADRGTVESRVSDNFGHAGLAMNETVERVRGNFQKAVDLLVSNAPTPVDSMHSDGGNAQ